MQHSAKYVTEMLRVQTVQIFCTCSENQGSILEFSSAAVGGNEQQRHSDSYNFGDSTTLGSDLFPQSIAVDGGRNIYAE